MRRRGRQTVLCLKVIGGRYREGRDVPREDDGTAERSPPDGTETQISKLKHRAQTHERYWRYSLYTTCIRQGRRRRQQSRTQITCSSALWMCTPPLRRTHHRKTIKMHVTIPCAETNEYSPADQACRSMTIEPRTLIGSLSSHK